ncbi:hypothetical protein BH23BAC3_BH23BAC3_32610 [soil metagenome]
MENGKIYWTERNAGTISRANLNGTQVEVLFINLTHPGRPHFSTENIGVSISLPQETRPVEFSLHQNYPNPFNPSTVISNELPAASDVTLEVFVMLGRRVALLVDEPQPAGTHSAEFDASNLASGIYLYRLQADGIVQTGQMILVK